jgi:hypothetical protein
MVYHLQMHLPALKPDLLPLLLLLLPLRCCSVPRD